MRGANRVVIKALIWCLVLEAIIYQGNSIVGDVTFTLMMKNEMYGLKRPSVVYQCTSSEKSLRWHISIPHSEFSWDFDVPPFGNGVVIHRCHFISNQGTADVEIKTLSMTSMLCGGHLCKYVIRPDGVFFVGFETYYPHNLLLRFLELVRPVDKLVEPWKAWSPRQLKALRERSQNRTRSDDDKDVDHIHVDHIHVNHKDVDHIYVDHKDVDHIHVDHKDVDHHMHVDHKDVDHFVEDEE